MAGEDPVYQKYLRSLECYMCGARPVEIHHRTGGGMALRTHDHEGIPLCAPWPDGSAGCHRDFHAARGHFRLWNKDQRRRWQDQAVQRLRANFVLDAF